MKKLSIVFAAIALVASMASGAFAFQSSRGFNGATDNEWTTAIASDTISVGNILVLDLSYSSVLGGDIADNFETGCVVKRAPVAAEVADTDVVIFGVATQAAVPGQSVTYRTRGRVQVLFDYVADSGSVAVTGGTPISVSGATAGYCGSSTYITRTQTAVPDGMRYFRRIGVTCGNVTANGLAYCYIYIR